MNAAECLLTYFKFERSIQVKLRLFLDLDHSVWKKSYLRRGDYSARLLALEGVASGISMGLSCCNYCISGYT